MWTRDEAIALCVHVEQIAPAFGCHVALTGGVLYKFGPRKDLDLLFYRIRHVEKVDVDGLFAALRAECAIERIGTGVAWCIKATQRGRKIDCFFPEVDGNYDQDDEKPATPVVREQLASATGTDIEF
jgi:hypothetical protein